MTLSVKTGECLLGFFRDEGFGEEAALDLLFVGRVSSCKVLVGWSLGPWAYSAEDRRLTRTHHFFKHAGYAE